MSSAEISEPFAPTSHPADYVSRAETDSLLEQLEEWALHGSSGGVWLVGPNGMGRTLLLRVLRERIAGQTLALFLPYPILSPRELARLLLAALGRPGGADPEAQLLKLARKRTGKGGLLLLLDDAMWLPAETLDALAAWNASTGGALRAVFASEEMPGGDERAKLGAPLVTLSNPLSLVEATALLNAAMDRARMDPRLRARFDQATLAELHEHSEGVPAQLLAAAKERLESWGESADDCLGEDESSKAEDPTATATSKDATRAGTSSPRRSPRPGNGSLPDATTSILAPTLPPERSTAATVGTAVAWLVAAAVLVALMTANMTGGLRDLFGAGGEPAALPDVAASPARTTSTATTARSEPETLADAAAPVPPVRAPEPDAEGEVANAAADAPSTETGSTPSRDGASENEVALAATSAAASAKPGAELPAVSAPPVEAKLPPVPVEFRAAEVETAPKPAAVVAVPESPAPREREASVAVPVEIARVASPEPPAPAPPASEPVVTVDGELRTIEDSLRRNEWLAKSLRRHGIPTEVATRISHEVGDRFDFRQARAGQRYRITQDADGSVVEFDFEIAPGDALSLRRVDGRYQVSRSGR